MRTSFLSLWFGRIATTLLLSSSLMAAENAFPPTSPKTNEIKTLPAGVLLKSTAPGNYFDNGGKLFGPLFRYISANDISMTTPVEANIDDAAMMFWVAPDQVDKVVGSNEDVEVLKIPERTVASRGVKGGYNQDNFNETKDALQQWLKDQTEWQATGEPYGVYWNGPFTPWFMKTAEVHIPVARVSASVDLSSHQWQDRVIVLSAPASDDESYQQQLALFAANEAGMKDRDLVVKTQLGAKTFEAVLIGKDGGQKWQQHEPLDPETLFALIDGMPMRRAEMRQRSSE